MTAVLIQQTDTAYSWGCKQRKHAPANADIWHLRFHWSAERACLINALQSGTYHFAPMQLITKCSGESIVKGIPRACPLSPLIGAFFLRELDEAMVATGMFYRRYMDDVILLAPTRWKLRRAVKRLNNYFPSWGWKSTRTKPLLGELKQVLIFWVINSVVAS